MYFCMNVCPMANTMNEVCSSLRNIYPSCPAKRTSPSSSFSLNSARERRTLFNLTEIFLCPKSKHYCTIAHVRGKWGKEWKNLLIRFVILFGEVSHYFRYITFIRHICTHEAYHTPIPVAHWHIAKRARVCVHVFEFVWSDEKKDRPTKEQSLESEMMSEWKRKAP